ncbi:tryptophan--tRNA ligase, partial [Candidatus Micrarchaeota archaeon]|nr:tryptophan--tRNA ligase [Candidatus Micrarchaeota archaeon]
MPKTQKPQIDPWGAVLIEDYSRLIKDFGLEQFDAKALREFPRPNAQMRRGVAFAGQGLAEIASAIKHKKPFYVLTGIMPSSEKLHFGNRLVIENVKYFQERGAHTFVLVADLEAAATRGITLEEAKKRAMNFHIPAYIAMGLDPKRTTFYFQSENSDVRNLAYLFSAKVTKNEFEAIYGSTVPNKVFSALTQVGDILYPQMKERMPGIIPVGADQSPHIRFSRDLVRR